MNEFENDEKKDDLDVEITDLESIKEASHVSKVLMAWEERPLLRKRVWRLATASSTLLLILLVIFSTFPSARDLAANFFSPLTPDYLSRSVSANATPDISNVFNAKEVIALTTGTSTPLTPSTTLGPAPRDCIFDTQARAIHFKGAPNGLGGFPVWVLGFGRSSASLTHLKHAQPPEIGWYQRITVLTETNYAGTVILRGGELSSRTPIWFGMRNHNQGPITSFTIQPLDTYISNHFGSDQEWGLLTIPLYIPMAGCYFLTATWPKGSWIAFFSAGR
jgi:hypothetical protein